MSNVRTIMLARFARLYGEPRTDDLNAFAAEYERALNATDPKILEAATDEIIKTNDRRGWPTVADCYKAVQRCAERRDANAKTAGQFVQDFYRGPSKMAQESEASKAATRRAQEWRKKVSEPYNGDFTKWLEANVSNIIDPFGNKGGGKGPSKSKAKSIGEWATTVIHRGQK